MKRLSKAEIRKDYIQEKYVIISPKRGKRPHDLIKSKDYHKPLSLCGFCPESQKDVKPLYKIGGNSWSLKVVPNKFPAVAKTNKKAYGQQEIIIETPDHTKEIEDLSVKQIADLFTAYQVRTKEISKDKKIEYILIFKNDGGVAGASLQHSHSQIFATEFLPPHLLDKSKRQQEYRLQHGTCVYCDVIAKESKSSRLIWQDKNVIAFCPYASMFNYEVWVMPKKHQDNITDLSKDAKLSMAKILKHILLKISQLDLPYNFYFHQLINDNDQHLYLKVVPRGSVWAGVEIGSGLIINPIPPEEAAEFYRKGL